MKVDTGREGGGAGGGHGKIDGVAHSPVQMT